MTIRGIRGATTIKIDSVENVLSATRELLITIFEYNPQLKTKDIASAIFTTTEDINSTFPALAARQIGWGQVPMVCAREIPIPDSLPRCIRVLIHWNTNQTQNAIQHIYLHDAKTLRPDLMAYTSNPKKTEGGPA